jgi:hypothetical protein
LKRWNFLGTHAATTPMSTSSLLTVETTEAFALLGLCGFESKEARRRSPSLSLLEVHATDSESLRHAHTTNSRSCSCSQPRERACESECECECVMALFLFDDRYQN